MLDNGMLLIKSSLQAHKISRRLFRRGRKYVWIEHDKINKILGSPIMNKTTNFEANPKSDLAGNVQKHQSVSNGGTNKATPMPL